MSVRLFSTYFNPQVLVSLPSVTRSSYFRAISSMSFLMLSPSFHLSGCLICTDFHQSSLANPTGFSGYLSMVSIAGKICTGKIALWRDFPAIVTLHFEAYPTDSSWLFSLNCLKFPLSVICQCPVLTAHSVTSPKVPVTSTQPNDAFFWYESGWANQWPRSLPPPRGRLNFQMGKTWNGQTLCF